MIAEMERDTERSLRRDARPARSGRRVRDAARQRVRDELPGRLDHTRLKAENATRWGVGQPVGGEQGPERSVVAEARRLAERDELPDHLDTKEQREATTRRAEGLGPPPVRLDPVMLVAKRAADEYRRGERPLLFDNLALAARQGDAYHVMALKELNARSRDYWNSAESILGANREVVDRISGQTMGIGEYTESSRSYPPGYRTGPEGTGGSREDPRGPPTSLGRHWGNGQWGDQLGRVWVAGPTAPCGCADDGRRVGNKDHDRELRQAETASLRAFKSELGRFWGAR